LRPITTQADLVKALADGMQEIYLNLHGETNPFANELTGNTNNGNTTTKAPSLKSAGVGNTTANSTNEPKTNVTAGKFQTNNDSNTTFVASSLETQSALSTVTPRLGKEVNRQSKPEVDVWEECFTETGEKYYYNNVTGETSWEPDRDPTAPWIVCKTDTGDKYFYNPETDQSTWDFPG